jgi:DNA-binding response OmpR family regulator
VARILLVDDDALVRKVVRVVLEAEGHVVTDAPDGPTALAAADGDPPQAVVLDLVIPGMDGFDVCRKLKQSDHAPKVLVLTSVPQGQADEEARQAGADDVMSKPFSALELLDRVSKLVSG